MGLLRRLGKRTSNVLPASLRDLVRSLDRARRGAPQLGLPHFDRALVVAAHPDDETAMCGGTIALLAARGSAVTVVVATDGQATSGGDAPAGEIATARRAEVVAACAVLGAAPPRLLGHIDGRLAERASDLEAELASVITEVAPQLVIVPWWLDDHPDHRAVCRAVAHLGLPRDTTVWLGEIWTPLQPNRVVDISTVAEQKRRALELHHTANRTIIMEAMLGLSRYRSLFGMGGKGHAEAFLALDADDLRRLVSGDG